MTLSSLDLEKILSRVKTEKSRLMKKTKELLSCLSQTTTSSGQITDRLLKDISTAYLRSAFNDERAVLKHCNREVSVLLPFILELRRK